MAYSEYAIWRLITCGYKSKKPDLMTKNAGIAFAIKHMTAMGIRFADGRSEAAVKLQHVEINDEWKVELSGTYLNAMKKHEVP